MQYLFSVWKFIRNDNGQDVYAHYSAIVNKNPNHRVRSLADGELVQFNIIEGNFIFAELFLCFFVVGKNKRAWTIDKIGKLIQI